MPQPVVRECAWHPKYHGYHQYKLMVPLPRGMTVHEFVEEAKRQDAITHTICPECKPFVQAEIRASEARRANRRSRR